MLISSSLKRSLAGLLVVIAFTLLGLVFLSQVQSLSLVPAPVITVAWGSDEGIHGAIRATDNIPEYNDQTNRLWDYTKINDGQACNSATTFTEPYLEGSYLYPTSEDAGKRYCFRSGWIYRTDGVTDFLEDYVRAGYAVSALLGDRTAPRIISITSSLADGSYTFNDKIPVELIFSEPVFVYGNTPSLAVNTKNPNTLSNDKYLSGSGSNRLLFELSFSPADGPIQDLNILSVGRDGCSHPIFEVVGNPLADDMQPICTALYAPMRDASGNPADLSLPNGANLADNKDIAIIAEVIPQPPEEPRQPKELPNTGVSAPVYLVMAITLVSAWLHRRLAISRAKC